MEQEEVEVFVGCRLLSHDALGALKSRLALMDLDESERHEVNDCHPATACLGASIQARFFRHDNGKRLSKGDLYMQRRRAKDVFTEAYVDKQGGPSMGNKRKILPDEYFDND